MFWFAAFIAIALVLTAIFFAHSLVLMWAWNILVPIFWATAPHFTFAMSMAATLFMWIVEGFFGAIFHRSTRSE